MENHQKTKTISGLLLGAGAVALLPISKAFGAGGAVEGGLKGSGVSTYFGSSGFLNQNWTAMSLIVFLIKVALIFAGLIAVAYIIWSGYTYMTAGGSAESAEKGRAGIVNAVTGLVIILLAYLIVNVVINTFSGDFLGSGVIF